MTVGRKLWAIAEGYIPSTSHGPAPEMTSHETVCLLNTSDGDAHVRLTIYFSDREPAGPYHVVVPARRTRHVRFNDLTEPEPIPVATDFASVIESDVPVVVQHTRLDSRQAENALLLNGRSSTGIPGLPPDIIVNTLPPAAVPVQGLFAAAGAPGQVVRPIVRIQRPTQPAITAAGSRAAALGGEVTAALSRAMAELETDAYHAPFAMVASTRIWNDINQPSAQSLRPARLAIERLLQGGPLLHSASLPAGFALVFAHDCPELEQVMARDIGVKFLNVSEEPRFVFRVSVRTALRVRDRRAIAILF